MQGGHLPVRDRFAAMSLLTATKHAISAKKIQSQFGCKRYQPVWEIVHKLRDVMGKRDGRYPLHGDMEIDEGSFSKETPEEQKDCPLKRVRGSQRNPPVLIMAERSLPKMLPANKYSTPKCVGHIKIQVIGDFKAVTITDKIKQETDGSTDVTTDGFSSYVY